MTAATQTISPQWAAFDRLVDALRPEVERLTTENPSKASQIVEAVQRLFAAIELTRSFHIKKIIVDRFHQKPAYSILIDDAAQTVLLQPTVAPLAHLDLSFCKIEGKSVSRMLSVGQALNISYNNPLNLFGSSWGTLIGESEALANVKNKLLAQANKIKEEPQQ